eukprot:gene15262-67231_t
MGYADAPPPTARSAGHGLQKLPAGAAPEVWGLYTKMIGMQRKLDHRKEGKGRNDCQYSTPNRACFNWMK